MTEIPKRGVVSKCNCERRRNVRSRWFDQVPGGGKFSGSDIISAIILCFPGIQQYSQKDVDQIRIDEKIFSSKFKVSAKRDVAEQISAARKCHPI